MSSGCVYRVWEEVFLPQTYSAVINGASLYTSDQPITSKYLMQNHKQIFNAMRHVCVVKMTRYSSTSAFQWTRKFKKVTLNWHCRSLIVRNGLLNGFHKMVNKYGDQSGVHPTSRPKSAGNTTEAMILLFWKGGHFGRLLKSLKYHSFITFYHIDNILKYLFRF